MNGQGPDRWVILGYACPWLGFLLFFHSQALVGLAREGQWPTVWAGVVLLAAFVVVYTWAFFTQNLNERVSPMLSTLAFVGLLALIVAGMWFLFGIHALTALSYLVAVWVYRSPIRSGILGALLINAVALALCYHARDFLPVLITALPSIFMLVNVASITRDEELMAIHHQLDLSQQREQIARDVHDTLGHYLTATHVKAQLVGRLLDKDPARARQENEEIIALTRRALTEARGAVEGVTTPNLGEELARAQAALRDAGIKATVPTKDTADQVTNPHAELFAWVLREAVTNIIRHAGASKATITVEPNRLVVADNGVGMGSRAPGMGLRSITHRVDKAGATLKFHEAHPGTIVEVRL